MISSFGGKRGSPHRRQPNGIGGNGIGGGGGGGGGGSSGCGCGIIPRDKMSRFVFLSVLLVAYSGVTLGLILWNSSGAATRSNGVSMTEERERRASLASTVGQSEERARTPAGEGWARRGDRRAGVNGEPATGPEFPGNGGLEPEAVGSGKDQLGGAAVYDSIARAPGAGGTAVDGTQNFGRERRRDSLGLGGEGNAGGISGSNFGGAVTRPKAAELAGVAPPTSPSLDQPFDVTLVSQTSQNRFWMLPFLCKRWPGPISIAILEEDKEALPEELCSRMVISATAAQTPEELDPVWYPVNRLRNVAVNAVKTSHFLMTDIDIWPDVNAYQALHMRFRLETERMEDAHSAIVFSAFSRRRFCEEEDCLEYAKDVPETISDLKPCLETNTCGRFDAANQSGQGTAYVYYWRSMLRQPNQRTLEHILCFKSHRFEPYLVVRKTPLLPKFDERFLGYGKNKIQWINHLRYSGFSFYVMPVNFVIHAPHPKSVAKTSWERTGGGKQGKGNKLMDQTFDTFMAELREEKGPEEDTVTSLCQKDRPPVGKKPSQFKKRSKVQNV